MAFCRACGENNPNASLFCAHCGYRLQPLVDEVTIQSNPPTTHVSSSNPWNSGDTRNAPTFLTPPSQGIPTDNIEKEKKEEEEEDRLIIPPIIPPAVSATGNVPSVIGTPQLGTVPSVPSAASGGAGSVATTITAGAVAQVVLVLVICAAVVLAAVKVVPPILTHITSPSSSTTATTSVPGKATTVPVPPTQTNCPQGGTARTSVTRTLALGSQQEIIYVENTGQGNAVASTLWRYNITTHQQDKLIHFTGSDISFAQLSTDGQWVSFVLNIYGQAPAQGLWEPLYSKVEMIRVDGQGLQTLYCSASGSAKGAPSSIVNLQWSPDQHSFVFVEQYTSTVAGDYYPAFLSILNATDGKVQKLASDVGAGAPRLAWLDNRYIYMLIAGQAAYEGIYVLDTNKGGNPAKIVPNPLFTGCMDYASGYNSNKLYVSQCAEYVGQNGGTNGPSSITERPAMGGTPTTIDTLANFNIRSVSVATKTSLLLLIENQTGDLSHNGLWKIHTDGTGLTQLTSDPAKTRDLTKAAHLNGFSKYPWANVSRDGQWYALEQNQTLLFDSMNGGPPTTFATMAPPNTTGLYYGQPRSGIIGWTNL